MGWGFTYRLGHNSCEVTFNQISVLPAGQNANLGMRRIALEGPTPAASIIATDITTIIPNLLDSGRCLEKIEPQNSMDHR